ncbi:hypothetical protein ABC255_08840 [Neobacillus sp. 3P2-tot-E-2]|uniref:hypothetical protein n=1 Tax=Neobacillus sp. 3P2-tot-E-2 TaxID=3132212 RepID=UPI0039A01E8E
MIRRFCILGLLLVISFISGCNQKPSTVSQEIWDEGIQYTIYLNETINGIDTTSEGFNDAVLGFLSQDEKELSKEEKEITNNIRHLNMSFLEVKLYQLTGADEKEARKEYDKYYKKLEETFGKSNLNEDKLDVSFINSVVKENETKKVVAMEDKKYKFMKEAGVSLTAKEVQFNMSNNLDEKFFLEGTIELCDYYNYGFTNESKFFCGQVTPLDGGYSDSWYLYFNRTSYSKLYDGLLNGQVSNILIAAQIPSKVYKSSQGNMAVVNAAYWE